jgi:N-methylhydantoinase A
MHEATYGYHIAGAVVELISFKVTAIGAIPKPRLGKVQTIRRQPPRQRQVYFVGHGFIPCQIVRRAALPIGEKLSGPLIVEEEGATTLVEPGMHLIRNEYDVLLLTVGDEESSRNV